MRAPISLQMDLDIGICHGINLEPVEPGNAILPLAAPAVWSYLFLWNIRGAGLSGYCQRGMDVRGRPPNSLASFSCFSARLDLMRKWGMEMTCAKVQSMLLGKNMEFF